jgi:hypothetical protein
MQATQTGLYMQNDDSFVCYYVFKDGLIKVRFCGVKIVGCVVPVGNTFGVPTHQ